LTGSSQLKKKKTCKKRTASYASLITSLHWQKKHEEAMLIQVRSFSGKQNNPSITWEWPGRDSVCSLPWWEASSNL